MAIKIAKDKLMHFVVGAIVSAIAFILCASFYDAGKASSIAIGAAVIAGIAKEVVDAQGYGTPEVMDAIATVMGGIAITVILSL